MAARSSPWRTSRSSGILDTVSLLLGERWVDCLPRSYPRGADSPSGPHETSKSQQMNTRGLFSILTETGMHEGLRIDEIRDVISAEIVDRASAKDYIIT